MHKSQQSFLQKVVRFWEGGGFAPRPQMASGCQHIYPL